MGGAVISTENAKQFSSVSKGETLEDTIRIINGYADVIVLRHYEIGSSKRAADVSKVPIINAGDGTGQHPTQAFLDLYTIQKELGDIDGISIAVVGDLANGRTGPLALLPAGEVSKHSRFTWWRPTWSACVTTLRDTWPGTTWSSRKRPIWRTWRVKVDVVYQTRIQKERFGDREEDYERARGVYIVDEAVLSTHEATRDHHAPPSAESTRSIRFH